MRDNHDKILTRYDAEGERSEMITPEMTINTIPNTAGNVTICPNRT
jgi:hypothetical protein